MIWLITIFIAACAATKQVFPDDCFLIPTASSKFCYTFSNDITANFGIAQVTCESTGGQLAAITNGTIWQALKQKYLDNFKYPDHGYVWVGITVEANFQTDPAADLKFVKWWKNEGLGHYPNTCLAQYPPDWMWWGTGCQREFHYFCEYEVFSNEIKY